MGQGRRDVSPMVTVSRPYRIAVIGAAGAGREDYELARHLGGLLASAGAVVLCGGHGGVMEGVARGAAEAGGLVVGILKGGMRTPGSESLWPRAWETRETLSWYGRRKPWSRSGDLGAPSRRSLSPER
jgi:predicted Rossmann-fold nucleotide-binding protein